VPLCRGYEGEHAQPVMKQHAIAIGLIVLAVALLRGGSVRHGLLVDDYNHRAELREGGWSFRSLVEASHLGGPRRRVQMWWQEEAELRFFRPLAFGLMRLEYLIAGWHPAVMHVFSLGWTVLGATLVMLLARAVLGSLRWAGLAGVLFAIHPANYLTQGWIACQSELMLTAFVLSGLLFYGRYSGWQWRVTEPPRAGGSGYLAGALACLVATLGCRENGVLLVPLWVLGDGLLRPARTKGRWGFYGLLGGIVAGYQWRAGMGPRQAFWGLETDIVSLDLLQGGQPGGPDWLATVRARYGINLVGNLSVYGTAGLAGYADHQASTRIKPALAAGGGIETAGANSIRTRLEYLYSHSLDGDVSHQVRAALLIGLR